MKKILIFSTAYLPLTGGAEIAIKEITNRNNDFEFDLITARLKKDLPKKEKIGQVNVYRIGLGNSFDKFLLPFLGVIKALKLNKKKHYEVIWAMMASQASVGASFFKILKPQKKLLLTLQEGDEEEHLKRYVFKIDFLYNLLIKPIYTLVFKKADYIQVISSYLKERALKNKARCPIEIVPNGVDVEYFSKKALNNELKKIIKKFDIDQKKKHLITTSRLVKKNAVDDVIKAFSYLPEEIDFLILGDGPDKNKLKKLIKKLKLENRIKFLGNIDYQEIPKFLQIADIFIRPSLSEGFGNSFIEAMAVSLPVIATQEGGIKDFLFDKHKNPNKKATGWAVEKRDPKGIAKRIKEILNSPKERKKIAENAQKMVLEKYDWNIVAQKMKNIFNKL